MSRNKVLIIISFVFDTKELFIFYRKNYSSHYATFELMYTVHKPI